jgi:hypothetical protein
MTFDAGTITMLVVCWSCGAMMLGIALWARAKKTPMHFWSGYEVKSEEIADVRGYNRAMMRMWAIYGLGYFVAGLAAFFSMIAVGVAIGFLAVPGVIILIVAYSKIYAKYRAESARKAIF